MMSISSNLLRSAENLLLITSALGVELRDDLSSRDSREAASEAGALVRR